MILLNAMLSTISMLFLGAWLVATVAVLVIATVALWFLD